MDDLIGKAVVDSLGCRHPVIPVGVLADPLDRLSGLGGDDLAQSLAHLDDLAESTAAVAASGICGDL
jgi:hypothetical protein